MFSPSVCSASPRNGFHAPLPRATPTSKIVIFDDFENMHGTAFDQIHGSGAYRSWHGAQERLVDLGEMNALVEKKVGAVAMHRAFGPFSPRYRCYFDDMAKHLVSPVFVPTSNGAKNSADILLVCQAIKLCLTDPSITHFVIATCDADFSSLAKELREMGKVVVGLGIAWAKINSLWVNSCSTFLYLPIAPVKSPASNGAPAKPTERDRPPNCLTVRPEPTERPAPRELDSRSRPTPRRWKCINCVRRRDRCGALRSRPSPIISRLPARTCRRRITPARGWNA